MKRFLLLLVLLLLLNREAIANPPLSQNRLIDVVFCMDLSGSTNGLIDGFRERYWDIILDIYKSNPNATLRFGIVSYGRPTYEKSNYYVKILVDLTDDFDLISSQIFEIQSYTEIGTSNIGNAIHVAVTKLNWSKEPSAYKLLYVIGNGNPETANYNYLLAAQEAVEKNIKINVIYCKNYVNVNEENKWKELAFKGQGKFFVAKVERRSIFFDPSPEMELLQEINLMLNKTYVFYTPKGKERISMILEQDKNASSIHPMVLQSRIFFKSTKYYQGKNYLWDLVDLSLKQEIEYKKIYRPNLPEELINASDQELKKYIFYKKEDREYLLDIIKTLSTKREEYIKNKKKELKINDESTLGFVIIDSLGKSGIK